MYVAFGYINIVKFLAVRENNLQIIVDLLLWCSSVILIWQECKQCTENTEIVFHNSTEIYLEMNIEKAKWVPWSQNHNMKDIQ